jgi:TonB family protein
MAFEAFLDVHSRRTERPRRRRLTYTLSLAVHGAALAAAIGYSFWRVDELSPPTVKVTFMNPAPPAPPPPPAGGGGETKKKAAAHKPHPSPTALVQPSVTPPKPQEPPPHDQPQSQPAAHDDDDDDDDRGFAGGQAGGRVGGRIGGRVDGTVGGAGPAAPVSAPRMMPPVWGAGQKSSGADPDLPPFLNRPGRSYVVTAKICVTRTGTVESVTIMQGADAQLDRNVVTAVKAWRYRPLMANDMAVPFCYFGRFEFNKPPG